MMKIISIYEKIGISLFELFDFISFKSDFIFFENNFKTSKYIINLCAAKLFVSIFHSFNNIFSFK